MNDQNQRNRRFSEDARLKESRTAHFNLAVRHPALWRFALDQLLAPATRLHRYRNLTTRMYEESMREIDRGDCHE